MLKEFRRFALRGNAADLAVGIILGSAFTRIVNSLVSDVLMPPIGLVLGRVDFGELYLNLSGEAYASLSQATAAGAATDNYGLFLTAVVEFLFVAGAVFLLVKGINRLQPAAEPEKPDTRDCPYCLWTIPRKARRCAFCTARLPASAPTARA